MCFHGGMALYLYLKCKFLFNEKRLKTPVTSGWGRFKTRDDSLLLSLLSDRLFLKGARVFWETKMG